MPAAGGFGSAHAGEREQPGGRSSGAAPSLAVLRASPVAARHHPRPSRRAVEPAGGIDRLGQPCHESSNDVLLCVLITTSTNLTDRAGLVPAPTPAPSPSNLTRYRTRVLSNACMISTPEHRQWEDSSACQSNACLNCDLHEPRLQARPTAAGSQRIPDRTGAMNPWEGTTWLPTTRTTAAAADETSRHPTGTVDGVIDEARRHCRRLPGAGGGARPAC